MNLRLATRGDVPSLTRLIEQSVRKLHRGAYTPAEIELALGSSVYGVDTTLVADGTYYVIESDAELVAGGGWSKRAMLYGGDRVAERSDALLDPVRDAAKIRAFFVAPAHVRQGLASRLLSACECAASAAGFGRAELGATRTGVPFYAARGYTITGSVDLCLGHGERLAVIHMEKLLRTSGRAR